MEDWYSRGLIQCRTDTAKDWYSRGLIQPRINTAVDWYSRGLIEWKTYTAKDWYSGGLIQRRTDTAEDWYSRGLIQWRTDTAEDWYSRGLIQWKTDTAEDWYSRGPIPVLPVGGDVVPDSGGVEHGVRLSLAPGVNEISGGSHRHKVTCRENSCLQEADDNSLCSVLFVSFTQDCVLMLNGMSQQVTGAVPFPTRGI